jgi:hypothetical protein
MHENAIVETLLAGQPVLRPSPANYQPPAHVAGAADKFYRHVMRPAVDIYMDQNWALYHWDWSGTILPDGQIYFYAGGYRMPIHRFLWELTQGPVPKGQFAKAACGRKTCVSVHHVRLRGRVSAHQRLNKGDVKTIVQLYTMKSAVPARRLAEIFEVSERRIYQVLRENHV